MPNFLQIFEEKAPEIIFEWNDRHTNAQAWPVINSLRGGAVEQNLVLISTQTTLEKRAFWKDGIK